MSKVSRTVKVLTLGACLAIGGALLTACSTVATTSDMCAYTQGDGSNGSDAKVHEVYYPDEKFTQGGDEDVYYFPCNARNLRFEPGSTDLDAQGKPLSSVVARTSTGNQVKVDVEMFWMLNQDKDVLKNVFIPLCNKYQCASSDANARNSNFSTDGWSKGFLGENAVPVLQSATQDTLQEWGDDAWSDPSQKAKIASKISNEFMQAFHANTGSTKDVICASGESSGWNGKTFHCGPVRIVVRSIIPTNSELLDVKARQAQASLERDANAAELNAAKQKYGDDAGQVLGNLDIIKACAAAKMTICSAGGMTVGTGGNSGSQADNSSATPTK